jgi:molybdopterin/thiamine biosynthesis adenylyltransferase
VPDLHFERPRIKEIYGVFVLDGRVRLGTGEGYAAQIDDPDGRYGRLITLLNGSRSMAQLREELRDTLGPADLDDALRELDASGYLEDAAEQPPPELSHDELERYRANLNFFSTLCSSGQSKYDYQTSLKRLRVGLIGLGGIGSNVAMALAELGVGAVRAVDFDKVELSNLNRQVLYSTPEVGELKAAVATRRLYAFNPTLDFSASAERITTADDAASFIEAAEPHVVFCLADKPNGHIDHWVNRACVDRGVTMIAGSIFAGIGNAYSVVPGQSACYNCRVAAELERAPELSEELHHIQDAGFNVSNGATGPTCMFHAYFLVYEMLRIVSHIAPPLTANRLFEINFLTFEQHFTDFPMREDCAVCGGVRPA